MAWKTKEDGEPSTPKQPPWAPVPPVSDRKRVSGPGLCWGTGAGCGLRDAAQGVRKERGGTLPGIFKRVGMKSRWRCIASPGSISKRDLLPNGTHSSSEPTSAAIEMDDKRPSASESVRGTHSSLSGATKYTLGQSVSRCRASPCHSPCLRLEGPGRAPPLLIQSPPGSSQASGKPPCAGALLCALAKSDLLHICPLVP